MSERALEQTCRDCGRPLSFHDGIHAVRCETCFSSFLTVRDRDFLSSYAELGVRSRRIVAETPFEYEGDSFPVTVSVGVACVEGEDVDVSSFIKIADDHLYRAKREGRNRVVG